MSILYLAGVQLAYRICLGTRRTYCTILYYHSIPTADADGFKKQLDILRKVVVPIGLDHNNIDGKRPKCIITFDDALESFVSNGVPELASRNMPFVVFVPTGSIGQKPAWLSGTQHKDEDDGVASVSRLMGISSKDVTFGSHSVNHPDLTALAFDVARSEIEESKQFLESSLRREIKHFSFPHGSLNASTIEMCREAGYSQVFSTLPESPLKSMNAFVKGRTKVDPSDWGIEFLVKALGGYGWKNIVESWREERNAIKNERKGGQCQR